MNPVLRFLKRSKMSWSFFGGIPFLILPVSLLLIGCDSSPESRRPADSPPVRDRHTNPNATSSQSDQSDSLKSEPQATAPPMVWTMTELWRMENLGAPMGLAFNAESDEIYLVQVGGEGDAKDGDGVVSRISLSGEMLELTWGRGFDAPKDLLFRDQSLWVTDINAVVELDRMTATIKQRIEIPDAKFLVGSRRRPTGRC